MRRKLIRAGRAALLEFPGLMRLLRIKDDGKIIHVDYGYWPRERNSDHSVAHRQLIALLNSRRTDYMETLRKIAAFAPELRKVAATRPANDELPFWHNTWLPVLDGITLYGLLVLNNPRQYVEIGSGNSTKFARQAIRDHSLRTRIISIDPAPRTEISRICDENFRSRCEDMPTKFFEELIADDILFFDGSHRSFQNSDVTVFFTEILPALPRGMLLGLHDIFLPADYPERWTKRFYNEQYLLAAYLFGGIGGGEIVLPCAFIEQNRELLGPIADLLDDLKTPGFDQHGAAFWLRK